MKKQKQVKKKKIVLGITGSFGSGKTTVAKMFSSSAAEIIDADRIAYQLIKFGGKTYKRIVGLFGRGILDKDRNIDHEKVARIVFNQKSLLRRLNQITHPEIIKIIRRRIKKSAKKLVILDAPLLIEAGLRKLVDRLIVVKINRKEQLKRLQGKTSFAEADILKRIKAQMPQRNKLGFADFIIDNSNSREKTKKQVEQIRRFLWKS